MITLFTPSYNRCSNLKKLYESLCKQTDKNFIWYIIDDGSNDNTAEYVDKIKKENIIEIMFQSKNNEGKHSTFNILFDTCKTDYFMCVDSDDYLLDNAVEIINDKLLSYFENDIWGIVGPRVKENGNLYSNWMLNNNFKMKFCNLYSKYKYVGDTYIIIDVKKVKDYRFPIYNNEKLVPENVLYDFLDEKYFVKTSNYCFYIGEYKEDGYTKNGVKLLNNSPNGVCCSNISTFNNKYNSIKIRALAFSRYCAIKKVFKLNLKNDQKIDIKDTLILIIGTMLYPIFCLHYWRKKAR